ncbi:MAG TPA: DUF3142 domain-containing protein [Pyrinomonadaceae bacterium]|jgi:hypothetical protein|nr:DUF3142 domain-containing protein [Pyrinomonadaceae bacterium]
MQSVPPRRFLILALLLVASLSVVVFRLYANNFGRSSNVEVNRLQPALILWAWERPEDLKFIDPQKVSVAYLAKTVFLRGAGVLSKPRLQPLSIASGTSVIPVARIELDTREPPALSAEQAKDAASEIAKLGLVTNASMVQVDFDATTSQHEFYRNLLNELRQRLPTTAKLSITALGSWCQGDDWLRDLPIDEAVPMLFRMGLDRNTIVSRLAGEGFTSPRCRSSAGISTDEHVNDLPRVSRLYVFNPNGWNREDLNKVMETYQR